MSTSHNGDYCSFKDKMKLGRQEAQALAGRLAMVPYKCKECGSWHIAHRRGSVARGIQRAKSYSKSKR